MTLALKLPLMRTISESADAAKMNALAALSSQYAGAIVTDYPSQCYVCMLISMCYKVFVRGVGYPLLMCDDCSNYARFLRAEPTSLCTYNIRLIHTKMIAVLAEVLVYGEINFSASTTRCAACPNTSIAIINCHSDSARICNDCRLACSALAPIIRHKTALVYEVARNMCAIADVLMLLCVDIVRVGVM